MHQRNEKKLEVAEKNRIGDFITCTFYLSSFCQSIIGEFYSSYELDNDVNTTHSLEDLDIGGRMLLK